MMTIPPTGKYVSGATTQALFSWTFPGAPIVIDIPLNLISRLQAELEQHESSGYRMPGVEAGGVLLGHRAAVGTLQIDDYLWVSSEEQPGSRYRLDTSALERLREEYSAPDEKSGGAQVVGYFRTQAEADLQLRDEEIGLVREHFRAPTDVVLLIATSRKPYTSGFLFWMTKDHLAPLSFKDFPLDARRLQAKSGGNGAAMSQPAQEVETARVPPASTDKVAAPAATLADDVSFHLRSKSNPERQSISNALRQIDWTEPPAAKPPRTAAFSNGPARASTRKMVAAAVFAGLALAGLSALLPRSRWISGPRQQAPAPVAAFPLQLEVEAQGDGLNVRWNPQSAPASQAREGQLAILEGDQQSPRIVPLDPQQLKSGHVYYRSSAERVQFQLEIVDASGGISRESVLALSSKPAPAVARAAAAPQTGSVQPPARKVESIPIASTAAAAVQLTNATQAVLKRQPARRAFAAPPSSQGRAGQVPAIAIDQPPAVSTDTVVPPTVTLPAALSSLPANNPPPPQVKEPPPPKQIRIGSLQAANLIRRVAPVYPPMAVSRRIQGTVRLTAVIGKDGTVRDVQPVSGNVALVKAAMDAVKQWVYRPTLLSGDPVEVVTQIDVSFTLNP